jgi:tRNA-guanine family transglycosylase
MCIGVVQGGMKEEQRRRHAQSISQLNGIGGFYIDVLPAKLTEQQKLASISISNLPPWLPRGMEASGSLEQVLALVACGVDYFISSYPYILSTHGYALDLPHKNNLWNIQYRNNTDPLSLHCSCPVCRRYTRAYLNHLLNTHEMLAMTLLMIHNSAQYIQFFHQIQQAIETKTFGAFQKQFLASRRVDDS